MIDQRFLFIQLQAAKNHTKALDLDDEQIFQMMDVLQEVSSEISSDDNIE